jgi:tRNA pseudouridine13 synthase
MKTSQGALPYLTAEIPGIAGALRTIDDDFIVRETPAYLPTGVGDHVMIQIRKRGLTTMMAVTALARALNVAERDMGFAGMKDRNAVTEQWLSAPKPVSPEQVQALSVPNIDILQCGRHPHKLRTGHVASNHFELRVRHLNAEISIATYLQRASAVIEQLQTHPGALNWYGEQRFGRNGDNAAQGFALLRGEETSKRAPSARQKKIDRLLVSSLQSELFNRWLHDRVNDGLYRRAIAGDVMRKRSGGMFVCDDPTVDQRRIEQGEIVVTGPMFGVDMKQPLAGSLAQTRELAVLTQAGITVDDFASVKRIASGTRRDIGLVVSDVTIAAIESDIVIGFTLDAGGYATAVMREIMKLPVARAAGPATLELGKE